MRSYVTSACDLQLLVYAALSYDTDGGRRNRNLFSPKFKLLQVLLCVEVVVGEFTLALRHRLAQL